jgi:hypothetical protein
MRPPERFLRLVALVSVIVSFGAVSASAAPTLPVLTAPATCSNTTAGLSPCTWTDGVNAYPGNSDGFSRVGTLRGVSALTGTDRFDTVVIDVPISAANYTDAHVEMPAAGKSETYNCRSSNASYSSPSSGQVASIGRRVLATHPGDLVVIRPLLALGGSCNPARYYPTGRYSGTGYAKGSANEAAFAHFYTAILLRLAADAGAIGYTGHVVLDDATGMDCLLDDPAGAGYVGYFKRLPRQISSRYPDLAQMASVDWNFADNPGSACSWPGSNAGRPAVNEAVKDQAFLSEVGIVGIQENFPLSGGDATVASVVGRWGSDTTAVAGSTTKVTADGLVKDLHTTTGADIVMSAIGYNDCSNNPAAEPTTVPSFCNKIYGKEQGIPSASEVAAEKNADTAAACYWSQAEGAADPWFLGLWWWNRDFDAAPYVNPYDLTWGSSNLGTSALAAVRAFQTGADSGGCPALS